MATKHKVIDKHGVPHKRVSMNRVYAYAVVTWYRPYEFRGETIYPSASATWCSRLDLAQKEFNRRRGYANVTDVEIIPATIG